MKKPPYKRIWAAFVTAALFAVSMPDKFLELYKEFIHSGLTPAFAVAVALWVSKEIRNKQLDRRDARWEKKLNSILTAVGVVEISHPEEAKSYWKSFSLSRKEIQLDNRRRKNMKNYLMKLGRTKLQVYIIFTIVNLYTLFATLSGTVDINTALQPYMPGIDLMGQLIAGWVYSHYQGEVDVVTAQNTPIPSATMTTSTGLPVTPNDHNQSF